MGYRLFIAEKPAMARRYAAALAHIDGQPCSKPQGGAIRGRDWAVTWLAGHVYELLDAKDYSPAWNVGWAAMPLPILPDPFQFKPIEGEFIEKTRTDAARWLQGADSVVIATDPGQEGQIIASIFLQQQGWHGPTYRLWSSATSVEGLTKAVQSTEPNDTPKYTRLTTTGMTRLYADWMIGINLTIAYTNVATRAGYAFTASAGRVQSVLLAIVVDHDDMCSRFKANAYYTATATFEMESGETFEAELNIPDHLLTDGKHCFDRSAIEALLQALPATGTVSGITSTTHKYAPPKPFELTTLSIALNKALGLSAKEVLDLYQVMYDAGWLTYPRVEDEYYEDDQLQQIRRTFQMLNSLDEQLASAVAGADLSLQPASFNSSRIEEHGANSPTGVRPKWDALDAASKTLYKTVALRMIAQFYPEHIHTITTAAIKLGDLTFSTKGKVIDQLGWMAIDAPAENQDEHPELPPLERFATLKLVGVELKDKKTRAPARMTEARLLEITKDATMYLSSDRARQKLQGKAKLGTVATRGAIIDQLITKRKYIAKDGKGILTPTKAGRQVRSLLPPELTTPDLTAFWEANFEQIRKGISDSDDFLRRLRQWVTQQVHTAQERQLTPNPLAHFCTRCKSPMLRRQSKKDISVHYWACTGTDCKTITPDLDGKPVTPLPGDGTPCEICQTPFSTRVRKRDLKKSIKQSPSDRRFLMCSEGHFQKK